jgi:hypothetical protein
MQLSEQKQEELFSNIINPNTGKKIQLGKSMSFNTDVFDSKTPYQQKIDEQKSFINRNEPIRMNLQALEDIPTVPSDMQVDYQEANNPQKNWYDTLNVASPEEIAEWRKKGKMGFGETAQKIFQLRSLAEKIPFLGTTATVGISADLMWSIDRLKKGKEISDAEKDLLVDYLRNLKEVQVRGTTLSSNVLNSIAESVPFAIEFAVGLGAIPVTGGGSSTLSMQALSKIASKKAAQKAIQNEIKRLSVESTMTGVKKNISGATTKQLLNQAMKDYALGGASQTAKIMSEAGAKTTLSTILKNAPKDAMRATVGSNPLKYMSATRFANNFADRQLAGSMYVTDAGEGVFTNPENWALSFMKAIGTTVFDNYSETVGFMFAPITNLSKWFAKPIRKVLPKKFYENLDNLVNSKFGMKASDAFRKYGYDGVLEEMGEELVNRFLCQTFGINGLDEYNIDGFLNNVLYANNPIQWATEALSFSAMSGAGHTIYGASSAIKEWNKKLTQSKSANALVEQMNNSDNAEYRSKQITKIQNQFEKYLKSNPINLSKNATPEEFQQKYDEAKFDFLENLSKKNMSAEEFYLEQGLVKIKGSQSAAERLLRKKLAQKGVDENTINDFIQSASENQIRDELKNHIIQDNEEKQKQQSEIERKKNEVVDKSYKLLLKGGVEKNVAWANAKLFGQFYEKYGAKNNQVFDKWFDKWEVEYNIPANERNARFQSANTAGAETSAEISDAQKEWQEKGTDSKYFKKWFGDSKVVDENGQPLVVYHGSSSHDITTFDSDKTLYGEISKGFNFFTNKKSAYQNSADDYANFAGTNGYRRSGKVYETYLKIQKPLHIKYTSNAMSLYKGDKQYSTPVEYYDTNYKEIKEKYNNGDYDGIIIENTDKNNDDSIIYLVPNSEQIKSVDNQGTFDESNPNIYYQSAYHGTPHKFDNFSTEHIGSGEGAQAHGWGLYFASNKKVSEDYRKTLSDTIGIGTEILVDNVTYKKIATNTYKKKDNIYDSVDDYLNKALNFIEIQGSKKKALKYVQEQIDNHKDAGYFDDAVYYIRIKDALNEIIKAKITKYADDYGQLYEVEIPEDDEMLDEDLPFSEQPQNVQEAFGEMIKADQNGQLILLDSDRDESEIPITSLSVGEIVSENPNGKKIYDRISSTIADVYGVDYAEADKLASELLNRYGIKGIKYDGQTDGQCYVIFNPENIDITRTFYQEGVNQKDSIEQRTDKSKYLTDNEVEQLKKDKENFVVYVQKMIDDKLSPLTQIRVLEKLPSAYNKISQLKGKKVVITQNVYKKIIDLPNKFNKNHNIDKKRALKLPEYLSDPLYILQSTSEGNEHRFVVVTASKGNKPKEKLSIILQPNNNVAVVSAYDEAINISEEKKNNRVLYDKKKELSKTLSASKAVTIDNSDTIITNSTGNFNSEQKTFLQNENEKFIAGYSYQEVMDKLSGLYDKLDANENFEEQNQDIMAQIHVLEDAYEVSENPDNYSFTQVSDAMLNAYYVMNNQKLPQDFLETDKKSERTYSDLLNAHNEKKEKQINEYHGYFTEGQNKNIITIMQSSNKSTALHELGHLFLNGLNELAKVSEEAKIQLDEVNKWLGYSGEYTVQQHEKFARSFEAYLYKGKAPNNKLRQVFENFKEWLKSVYKDISELVNQGADISDEVQQMFDRMFGNDEQYQEQKQVNELVNKIKKLGKRAKKTKETNFEENDETAKRHKEVCYEILSLGTGKSIKYLKSIFESNSTSDAMVKKRDNIEKLLDKVDDKISASGGMQPEWLEFFSNTGVSYNNDEVNASAELVRQAYDKIVNRAFGVKNYDNYLSEKAEYFEQAIEAANLQFDALVKAFKNENRDVALSAIYEWLEQLDEEIKPDFENKIIYEMGAIERNENADKFDIAKRKILQKAMDLEQQQNLKANEKYKQTVMEIIKNLDFLQPTDKAKLTANILDVPSVNFLMHKIENIMDIAKTMEDVHLRRMLEIEIHKELQSTKNIKKNGRTVGKYDYKTNKLFEELRELDRLSTEQANDIRLNAAKFSQAEDTGLSFKDKLINKFLSYKAGGRTYSDTELMKSIYDDILKVKLAGKCAKSEIDLNEKLDATKDIDELIEIVENKKDANFVLKGYINIFGNVESTLNALFNKEIKERYGSELLYAETNAQAWQHQQKQKFEKEVAKIYGLPKWCWDKKILEYLAEKHTYPEIRRKYAPNSDEIIKTRIINRTLTKMDIIQAYIWSKNDILEKRLINQFGEETLSSMFDEMSSEDVKLAELLMSTAQSFYPLVNKAFINKYGLDLPKVSCYFPSTPERGSEVDLFNEYSSKSLGNGFTKSRAESEILPMDFHNPVATLYSHIDGVSKFVFMSDILDKMNLRFKDLDLKRVIINKFGDDVHKTLIQELANVTYKKEAPVFNGMNKILDNAISNWITGNIAVKPIVGLKQLLSANNYAVDMPYLTWQKGFLKSIADYKNTIDYMMKIPYLKARYEGNFSNEFLKQTIENSAFATSKKLKDLCTIFVKIGDIGAIIFGRKPYIDYLINEKGMSEDEAIKQFVLSTNRSQQSSAISSLSNFQVNMTRNPIGKLFIAFKNSPQQYVRMCADALISATNGDMTAKQCAKVIFQYAYVQPLLYTIATSGALFRFMFTGDDDDIKEDAISSIFNLNADALPIVGDIYKFAIQKLLNQKALPQSTPLLGDIQTEINRLAKDGATAEDYLQAIGYLCLHVGLGYNSRAMFTMGSGVGDIFTGNPAKGSMKVFGYTDKRAKRITEK